MASISYAITACNEHEELQRLLSIITTNITDNDEVVVQLDTTATSEVKDVISLFERKIKVIEFSLEKNFATFKNNIKKFCSKDYILFIDADEYVSKEFIEYLPVIIETNPEVDLYYVPRWNTVEGLTSEHIKKWRWTVDEHNRVNFPDLQSRICRNVPEIKWVGKVHERLEGHKTVSRLPDALCLYHPKNIAKQEKQNSLYDSI
jgi:glycosyltransferase involved in cell wall biosynthesis